MNNFIVAASQMQEPTFDNAKQYFPTSLTLERFIKVVEMFYNKVNIRVLLEISCFKIQDEEELTKGFEEIFRMVITKINLNLRKWYKHLWEIVLKQEGIKLTKLEGKTIGVLYRDIEQ